MLLVRNTWALPCSNSAVVWKQQDNSFNSSKSRSWSGNPAEKQSANRPCPCFASAVDRIKIAEMSSPLPPISSVEAILFDVDGTLTDSDPLHYQAFRDMLQQDGYQGGEPITEEFFSDHISGKFNPDIGRFLFPDWEESRQTRWLDEKEALFRRLAAEKLDGKPGLTEFSKWIKKKNIRRAAVTNAPRANAEQMIAAVGLSDFFEHLIVGSECARGKPFPDPYLEALKRLQVPADHAFVFEDSLSGIRAAVDANLAVVGVVSGNPGAPLIKAGAAFTISDFADPALWGVLGDKFNS